MLFVLLEHDEAYFLDECDVKAELTNFYADSLLHFHQKHLIYAIINISQTIHISSICNEHIN